MTKTFALTNSIHINMLKSLKIIQFINTKLYKMNDVKTRKIEYMITEKDTDYGTISIQMIYLVFILIFKYVSYWV